MTTPNATVRPSEQATASSRAWWVLGALVALAAVLRFGTIDASSYWLDEAYTVRAVHGGLGGVWDAVGVTESTPPLYYVLAWIWAQPFGTSEIGLRSLSALLGTAVIPMVWLAGREILTMRAALIAAALTATSPLLIWFSQEARAYELVVLLCVVGFWQFLRARREAPHALAWWTVASALALTAHYIAIFPILVQAALLVWWRRERAVAVAVAMVGAVGVALVPLIVEQRGNELANTVSGGAVHNLLAAAKQFAVGYDSPWEVPLAILGLALCVVGLGLLTRTGARTRRGVGLCALVAVSSPVGLLILDLVGQNQVKSRYMLPALPLALLVLAAGFGARRAGRAGVAAATLLCLLGVSLTVAVALTPSTSTREDWRGAAHALGTAEGPRAIVIFPASGKLPLSLYVAGLRPATEPVAHVRELDFVNVERDGDHRHDQPFPDVLAANPQFRLAGQRRTATYSVIRYVAPEPADLPVLALIGGQAGGLQSTVLIQR